ncbi:reverse transcriptase domain-containing protein [Streptosporangium sandarakinum]|uniref:reverse transcriptase domain-containing protein n=1 Tax=Streptosporangium sandarakinum TaxID=1260955 RepID=UPI003724B7CE
MNLEEGAQYVTKTPLDHFPRLIIDRCLEKSTPKIAAHIASTLKGGSLIESEVVTMPRKSFGLRPVSITGPIGRTLYRSLVKSIERDLPAPSRGKGKYDALKSFGLDGNTDYVVEIDIAACYEYIDHEALCEELILRSMNFQAVTALGSFLTEVSKRPRGLPQMQYMSDRLADTYLSILDRKLGRHGYNLLRYADDLRVTANDWLTANSIIEHADEYARELGLILSTHKTKVYRRETLIDRLQKEATFFDKYVGRAKEILTSVFLIAQPPYSEQEPERVVIHPEEKEAAQLAYWGLLNDWKRSLEKEHPEGEAEGFISTLIPLTLSGLISYDRRVPDQLLDKIVFQYPNHLEAVCNYVVRRSEEKNNEKHWNTVIQLTNIARQSPWAKLWLLDTIEKISPNADEAPPAIRNWVAKQLGDRHESVRAQAVWVRATQGFLAPKEVGDIYRHASRMTQPAIAAAVARQQRIEKSIRTSIENDSPMNREATNWAEELIPNP